LAVEEEPFFEVEHKDKIKEVLVERIKELVVVINNKDMTIVVVEVVEVVGDLDTVMINHNGIEMHQYKLNQNGSFWKRLNSLD
jgi:hypothetical protein